MVTPRREGPARSSALQWDFDKISELLTGYATSSPPALPSRDIAEAYFRVHRDSIVDVWHGSVPVPWCLTFFDGVDPGPLVGDPAGWVDASVRLVDAW